MKRRLRLAFRRHPVITPGLFLAAVVVSVALSAQALSWTRWQLFAWRIERVSAPRTSTSTADASWSFAFRDRAVTLRVPVNSDELQADRSVDLRPMFQASGELRAQYVKRVVDAQRNSPFITSLASQLRAVRQERNLNGDEYLELMSRAVQSVRYGADPSRVRLPAEVATSGFGVCSEKAIMLSALMLHEGYETGMWIFDSQNHVALAVGSDAAQFRGSGYAFIETTRIAYVGEYDSDYLAAGPVSRPPQFIALGGIRQYHSGGEVEYILRELDAAKRQEAAFRGISFLKLASAGRSTDGSAAFVLQKMAAEQLAAYIRGQTDDREAAFERLVHSAVSAGADAPPALIR